MNLLEWLNSWERAWLFWMGMMGIAFFCIWMGIALESAVENFWVPWWTAQLM